MFLLGVADGRIFYHWKFASDEFSDNQKQPACTSNIRQMGSRFAGEFTENIKIIMRVLKTKSIASVELAEVELSLDELQVFEIALNYATKTLNEKEIERIFGASKDELEGISEDVEKASVKCKEQNLETALA